MKIVNVYSNGGRFTAASRNEIQTLQMVSRWARGLEVTVGRTEVVIHTDSFDQAENAMKLMFTLCSFSRSQYHELLINQNLFDNSYFYELVFHVSYDPEPMIWSMDFELSKMASRGEFHELLQLFELFIESFCVAARLLVTKTKDSIFVEILNMTSREAWKLIDVLTTNDNFSCKISFPLEEVDSNV